MPTHDRYYGIQLVDDIHTYFPAILYEPDRFTTVTDLLHYIRTQVRDRFDIFSRANSYYDSLSNTHPRPDTSSQVDTRTTQRGITRSRTEQPVPTLLDMTIYPQANINQGVTQLLQELLIPTTTLRRSLYQGAQLMEPVVVAPTTEQINNASTIETTATSGEICAICQDSIQVGTQVRSLDACDHLFHTGCIDTWFQSNVRCPVCRHDIRED